MWEAGGGVVLYCECELMEGWWIILVGGAWIKKRKKEWQENNKRSRVGGVSFIRQKRGRGEARQ